MGLRKHSTSTHITSDSAAGLVLRATAALPRTARLRSQFSLLLLAAALLAGCGSGNTVKTISALGITTTALPSGQVGVAYSATLAASGGTAPYSWSITSGTLPAGLALSGASISGTPTATASSQVTFQVADSSSPVVTQSATLTITIVAQGALVITTASLPSGRVGSAYTATLAASGGTSPYSWAITAGTLPAGLALNGATISGAPTAVVSNSSITFQVTDSSTPALTYSATLTITIAAAGTLAVTTSSLPAGRVGNAYSATLTASGGMTPYSWLITGLPAGLTQTGATISGTPTAAATATPVTVQVTDASTPAQVATVSLNLGISPVTIGAVSFSPRPVGLAATQTVALTATTNDAAGVNWSVSAGGGSFTPASSANGVAVTYTAPATIGPYTITATSITDPTKSSSDTIVVTDLAGVYSFHNDAGLTGANIQEYVLTTSNVNTTSFGKLFSCTADGAIYTQPLWVPNLTVNGVRRNVIFVATEHDGLFAFDADTSPCVQLWHANLIDTAHGAASGETTIPAGLPGFKVGSGDGDVTPEIGVTGTPVIDPTTSTLYVVSASINSGQTVYTQRLHAIDLTTGNEKAGSPVLITATYPGSYEGGANVTFDTTTHSKNEFQRGALALVNGNVYVSFASHEDSQPYYGWVLGYTYNGTALSQTSVLNVDPNDGLGGIWMSGAGPAADSNNNLYLITGNGTFDANTGLNDYGDSMLQIAPNLSVSNWFTPSDQMTDLSSDHDFGTGGAVVLPDLPQGSLYTHLIIGGGKDGFLYVLNRDTMGGATVTPANTYGDSFAVQRIDLNLNMAGFAGIFETPAYWNNSFYVAAVSQNLSAFALNPSNAQFSYANQSSNQFSFPGTTPSVSANGTSNGIVWALDTNQYCKPPSGACGPAVLHAYDATNLATELWNSSMTGADGAGNAVKFTVPTIANGKVYVGTRGNNASGVFNSTSVNGELDVYGVKGN